MAKSRSKEATFSIPSIIAVIAVILSFMAGAFWGFVVAVVAIVAAIIGVFAALSPNVRGGVISLLSLFAGALALVVALVQAILWLF